MMHTDLWDGLALDTEQIKLLNKTWPMHLRHLTNMQILRLCRPDQADMLLGMAEDFCRGVNSEPVSGSAHRDQQLAHVPSKPPPVRAMLRLVRRVAQAR
jgi:hypothetical protein